MTANRKIPLRALIKNTRLNHHISLADAISSSKSSLSRFESGKTELATDLILETFERVGLSFFDLHVQTNHFTPLWEQTTDSMQLAIASGDASAAKQAIADYATATEDHPSPLDDIYAVLFECMAQLCDFHHVLAVEQQLSNSQQTRILGFLKGKTKWHMLDFMLLQYSQWFMPVATVQSGFNLMAARVTTQELGNPNFLYRLAFFDTAVAIAQHLQMAGMDVTNQIQTMTETALQIHMSPQRALLMRLIIAQNSASPATDITANIMRLREIGLSLMADRLQLWSTISCQAKEAAHEQ